MVSFASETFCPLASSAGSSFPIQPGAVIPPPATRRLVSVCGGAAARPPWATSRADEPSARANAMTDIETFFMGMLLSRSREYESDSYPTAGLGGQVCDDQAAEGDEPTTVSR